MDSGRFDMVAKKAATIGDRRQILGTLGAVTLGLVTARGVAVAQVDAEDSLNRCKKKCENVFCQYDDQTRARRCERRCKRQCRRHHP